MNQAYLIQFAVSALAVALMVAIAAWATRGRPPSRLDLETARGWFADEFPGCALDAIWLSADGLGALARSGGSALVLSPMGHGYAARAIPWDQAVGARPENGRLRLALHDIAAPWASLAFSAWPPRETPA